MIGLPKDRHCGQGLLVIFALCASLLVPGAVQARFSELSAATWNMQGPIDANGENKWFGDVLPLMRGDGRRGIPAHDVVSLQEVGGVPQGAELTGQYAELGDALAQEYVWDSSTQGQPGRYYIYHLQVSNDGAPAPDLRTNLAVVSKIKAEEFHILRNQTGTDLWAREVIGVRLPAPSGNVMRVYSVHAGRGGHDADLIVDHIVAYDDGITDWLAMGTFNRDLLADGVAMAPPTGSDLYSAGRATHLDNGRPVEVDYAIANEEIERWTGHRMEMPSGHYAVRFGPPQRPRRADPRR